MVEAVSTVAAGERRLVAGLVPVSEGGAAAQAAWGGDPGLAPRRDQGALGPGGRGKHQGTRQEQRRGKTARHQGPNRKPMRQIPSSLRPT